MDWYCRVNVYDSIAGITYRGRAEDDVGGWEVDIFRLLVMMPCIPTVIKVQDGDLGFCVWGFRDWQSESAHTWSVE